MILTKNRPFRTGQYLPQPPISALKKFANWLPGFLAVIALLSVSMFGLENISRLHGYKQVQAQTITESCFLPEVNFTADGSTGPNVSSVGAGINYSLNPKCADRVQGYARSLTTTGNCGVAPGPWFDWQPNAAATTTSFTHTASACQADGVWEVGYTAWKGDLSNFQSVVIRVLPSGRTVLASRGTNTETVLNNKVSRRPRTGNANDKIYQILFTEANTVASSDALVREAVAGWNREKGTTNPLPKNFYSELAGRLGLSSEASLDTVVTRARAAHSGSSSGFATLYTEGKWTYLISTNPTTGCDATVVIAGQNTEEGITFTGQSQRGSACSADPARDEAYRVQNRANFDQGLYRIDAVDKKVDRFDLETTLRGGKAYAVVELPDGSYSVSGAHGYGPIVAPMAPSVTYKYPEAKWVSP